MESEKIAVIICAGGESKRFGIKKEYQKIDASPQALTVLGECVRVFSLIDNIDHIAITVPKNDEDNARKAIPQSYLKSDKQKLIFTCGGETRQASVCNSLHSLKQYSPDFVLIHDGARPFASIELIKKIIEAVKDHGAAIPVLPVTDTPKEYEGNFILRHLKRAKIGMAQTPQGFKYSEILQAHEKAKQTDEEFTDDAEIWGKFMGKVAVVPGEKTNKKITFKEDL